tara:strand:+ start:991 stop:2298 length:1308 start_codon:yes stop_codon:yes gene_type:complete
MNLIIKNGFIITVNKNNEFLVNSNICISDGRIMSVGSIPDDFDSDHVIDATNQIVMPGLINTHTHIPMTLFRNYADDLPFWNWLIEKIKPAEDNLCAEHVYWGAKLGVLEMIRSGITCFSDMYFFMDEVAEVSCESGIRAFVCGVLMDEGKLGEKYLKDAIDFYNNWHGKAEGRVKAIFGPHSIYLCSPEYLKEISKEVTKRDSIIHIHLSETLREVEETKEKFGKTPVQHLNDLGLLECHTIAAHCVHLFDEDIKILRDNKVSVLNNPTSNLKLGNGFAPVNLLLRKGINVSLGTDGAASNNNLNLFEEMHLASIINKAINKDSAILSANTVIRMATINGAKALGLENEIGSIEVGKMADIILIDIKKAHFYPRNDLISSIVYSAQASDVKTVLVNGEILMENYEIKTINQEETLLKSEKMAFDLIKRSQNSKN